MERKRGGSLKRKLSMLLAMLLVITGIPVNTVYAAEDNGKEIILDEKKDDVDVEAANAENSDKKEEEPLEEPTEEKEDNMEAVAGETEEGGNEEETYKVLTEGVSEYVSVTVYKDVDGNELTAEDTLEAGDKVYVSVAEDKGYAHNVPSCQDDEDFAEVTVGEETIGCYVFTIGEADLDLSSLIEVVAGDGTADTTATAVTDITVAGSVVYGDYTNDGSKTDDKISITTTYDSDDNETITSCKIKLPSKYSKSGEDDITLPTSGIVVQVEYQIGSASKILCNVTGITNSEIDITDSIKTVLKKGSSGDVATLTCTIFDVYTISDKNATITKSPEDAIKSVNISSVKASTSSSITNDGLNGIYKKGTALDITFTVELADGYTLDTTNSTVCGKTISAGGSANEYTATVSVGTDCVGEIAIVAKAVERTDTISFVSFSDVTVSSVTNTDYNKISGSDFKIYKSYDDGNTYKAVDTTTKMYKGDKLAIGTSADWVTLTLSGTAGAQSPTSITGDNSVTSFKLADGSTVTGVTFTAGEGEHTLNITATLSKDLVTFAQGNYQVYGEDGKVVADPRTKAAVVVMGETTTYTLKPESGYKLITVASTGAQLNPTDKYFDECKVELTFTSGSAAEKTVTVETKKGYTVEITTDDTIIGVYDKLADATNAKPNTAGTTLESKGKYFVESSSLDLFLVLNHEVDASTNEFKSAPYKLNALTVNGVSYLGQEQQSIAGVPNDAYIYELKLNLTEDVTIHADAILKTGDEVKFEGEHYKAYVMDNTFDFTNFTPASDLSGKVDYKAKGTYSVAKDGASNEVILLVADDNYRFTDVSLDSFKDSDFTYKNSGKYVVLSALTSAAFKDITADDNGCRTITLEAELEETVSLTLKDAGKDKNGLDSTTPVIVTEDYDNHDKTNGVYKTIDAVDFIYHVGKNSEVTVEFKVDTGYKLKDVKLGETALEVEQDETDKTKFTVNVQISKASELTFDVAEDEVQLKGLKFKSGNYVVASSDSGLTSPDVVADFKKADSEGYVLKLYKDSDITSMASNELVLYVKAIDGYAISEITYDDKLVYSSDVDFGDSEYENVTYTDNDYKLTIPTSELKNDGEQYSLVVKTTSAGLAKDYDFTLKAEEAQKFEGKIFFNAEKEFEVTVGDSADKKNTEIENVYTVYTVKASKDDNNDDKPVDIVINVTPKYANVTPVLKFKASGTAVENIIVDQTKSGETYTFTVSAAALSSVSVDEIYVDGVVATNKVSFIYDDTLSDIVMLNSYNESSDGEYLANRIPYAKIDPETQTDEEGNTLKEKVVTYLVRTGELINVDITVAEVAKRKVAKLTGVSGVSNIGYDEESAGFSLEVTSDANVTITAEALSAKVLTTGNDVVEAEESGKYVISYKTEYAASYYTGAELAEVNAASLTVNGAARNVTSISGNKVKFKVNQADAGKTASLTLQKKETKDGETIVTPVATFEFIVAETLTATGLSVEGVVDGVMTQTVGTEEFYAITIPEGTSIKDLKAVATSGMTVSITEDGYLYVIAPATAASDKAGTITLSNSKTGVKLQTITVKTVEVAGLVDAKLSVQALTSTDTTLRMNLTAAGVADVDVVNGKIAFKVTVTNQSKKNDALLNKGIFYVTKDGETTYSDNTVKVVDKATKENKYNVTVQLVRLDAAGKEIIKSTDVVTVNDTDDFVVAPSYYTNADELNLKNQVNTVYRGQLAAIADVDYGANANMVGDEIITLYDDKGSEVPYYKYEAYVEADKLYFEAFGDLNLGTYTVKVDADVPNNDTIAATASMTIKVEEGIWSFAIENVPNTLLKLDGKAVSFSAKAVFNNGSTSGIKNKKVTWSVKSDNTALENMVTISTSGKVTVNKNYVLAANDTLNTFRVIAKSEATGQTRSKEVVLTKEAVDLGELVLVEANADNSKFTKVDQNVISSDLACSGNLYLIAVKKSASSKTVYTVNDMMTNSVSFKPSNKNLAYGYAYLENKDDNEVCAYWLYADTTMKNVKITITALDGSKKTAQKVFNIDYADMSNMVMRVNDTDVNGSYKFVGTSEDTLTVKLGRYVNGKFEQFEGVLNTKVSITGGKILSSDTVNNEYVIKLTKDSATFTVANNGDKTKAPLTCVITNTAYDGFSKNAAPAVATTVKQLTAYSVNEQSITYTFKKPASYKFVKVQTAYADELKLAKKDANIYSTFKNAAGMIRNTDDLYTGYMIYPIVDGSFTIKLKENSALSAGAYKLYLSYGDYDANGNFVPTTKAGNVTIKAVASKSVDYTVDGNYTMSLLDTASVALTGKEAKGTDVTVKYLKAYSTVQEGDGNLFGKLFEIKDNQLALKSYDELSKADNSVTVGKRTYTYASWLNELVGKENAADLTGYVTYQVNGSSVEQQARVTVSLSKEALKNYTASSVSLLAGKDVTVPVSMYANNTEIKLKDATAVSPFKNGAVVDKDGALTLKTTTTPSTGTVKVTIVPESSFYNKYDSKLNNGIAVDVALDAKTDAEPIITFDDLNVSFTEYDGDGNFVGYIPYTNNIANAIKGTPAVTDSKLKIVKFAAVAGEDALKITVAKTDLDKTNSAVSYGDTKEIEVKVTFCSGANKTYKFNVKFPSETSLTTTNLQEVFTNIRKAVWDNPENKTLSETNQKFPTAIDFSKANELKLAADELAKAGKDSDDAYAKAWEAYKETAEAAVEKAVKAQLVLGAAVEVDSITVTTTQNAFASNGKLTVAITLTGDDVTAVNTKVATVTSETYTINTYIDVKLASDLMDVYLYRLNDFAKDLAAGKLEQLPIDNSLTEEEILSAARAYVLEDAAANYRLVAVEDTWKMTQSTSQNTGKYFLTLQVLDMYDLSIDDCTGDVKGSIDQLKGVADVKTLFGSYYTSLVDGTLRADVKDHTFSFNNLNVTTSSDDIKELAEAAIEACGNTGVSADFAEDKEFAITLNETTNKYEVSGTIVFTETVNGKTYTAKKPLSGGFDVKFDASAVNTLRTDVMNALASVKGLTNTEEGSKAAIENAVSAVVKNSPYSFTVTVDKYTQPTAITVGNITYTVSFEGLDDDNSAEIAEITYTNTIAANAEYLSLEEAVNMITQRFVKETEATVKAWFDATNDYALKDTDSDGTSDAIDAITAYLTGQVNGTLPFNVSFEQVVDAFHSAYVPSYSYEAETVKANGRVELSIKVAANTKDEDGKEVYEIISLNKELTQTVQTKAMAKAAIDGLSTSTTEIKAALKETLDEVALNDYVLSLIDEEKYAVDVKVEDKSTDKKTSYTVTITLYEGTTTGNVITTNSFNGPVK